MANLLESLASKQKVNNSKVFGTLPKICDGAFCEIS